MALYEIQDQGYNPSQQMPIERGNVLASSIVHLQPWTSDANPSSHGITQKVLLKLYDKDVRSFKLNEMVTCIGVLEYTQSQADA